MGYRGGSAVFEPKSSNSESSMRTALRPISLAPPRNWAFTVADHRCRALETVGSSRASTSLAVVGTVFHVGKSVDERRLVIELELDTTVVVVLVDVDGIGIVGLNILVFLLGFIVAPKAHMHQQRGGERKNTRILQVSPSDR
jgi:hypothetical protein